MKNSFENYLPSIGEVIDTRKNEHRNTNESMCTYLQFA